MKRYTDDAMSAAIADVKNGMTIRKAARKYSVPKSSLYDRTSGRIKEGAVWGKKPLFSTNDEQEMIKCAQTRAEMGIGFSKPNFLRFAGLMAKKRNITMKSWKPSEMWWRRLKKRNDTFSLRTPEPTATIRHDAMSRERMNLFFAELGKIVLSANFVNNPGRIWNMDETGLSLSHKPSKVVARKGTKTVHGKASTSRELITVIACGNADGGYIPPHFVFPGKTVRKLQGYDLQSAREKDSSLKHANFSVSDSGWTKDGIARLWFTETFLKYIGPARPQLLVCDGHGSHNNVEFVQLAKENDIVIVELPSHTSHWTQPLDRTVFKALKSYWNTTVDDFVKSTGVAVGHKQFLRLFDNVWQSAMTPTTIKNGFTATGIFPYNPSAIPEAAYAPFEGMNSNNPEPIEHEQCQTQSDTHPEISTLSAGESPEMDIVSSVTLSCPLDLEGQFDLPLVVDSSGELLLDSNISDPCIKETEECSPKLALEVIESTLTSEKKLKYQAALLSDSKLTNDPLFQTWKHYYNLLHSSSSTPLHQHQETVSSTALPALSSALTVTTCMSLSSSPTITSSVPLISAVVPPVSSSLSQTSLSVLSSENNSSSASSVANELFPVPKLAKKKKVQEYFVITADEIFDQMKKTSELKILEQKRKEEKRVERERKRAERALKLLTNGRGRGRPKREITDLL